MNIVTEPEEYPPQQSGKFLITGCPRSGTRSVAEYYNGQGLKLGHECADADGTVEWRHGYTQNPDFSVSITLVRDPIRTVISLTNLLETVKRNSWTWKYIEDLSKVGCWDDLLREEDYMGAAMWWWTSVYDRRFEFPIIKVENFKTLPHINHHINDSRSFIPSIHPGKFYEIALKYGYSY